MPAGILRGPDGAFNPPVPLQTRGEQKCRKCRSQDMPVKKPALLLMTEDHFKTNHRQDREQRKEYQVIKCRACSMCPCPRETECENRAQGDYTCCGQERNGKPPSRMNRRRGGTIIGRVESNRTEAAVIQYVQ